MQALIKWFIDNPLAANFLMLAMLIGGLIGANAIKKETFPAYTGNTIYVAMSYPGASAAEVEQQIVIRIEEAVAELPGIFQISSESRQGYGQVNIKVSDGFDVRELVNDVKARVDAINTFPAVAMRPTVRQQMQRQMLMWIALCGDADLRELKQYAYQIRDEMALLEGVSQVEITGLKDDELAIEISENTLREYNLSFDQVAAALRRNSKNYSAGVIRAHDGNMQITAQGQAVSESDFANIVVRSEADGGVLLLGDIAQIHDGFVEQNVEFTMNGKPGLNMQVKISDDPLLFEGTANARQYVKEFNERLPERLQLKINFESKSVFDSRFNLLTGNALSGLLLVFGILLLFLRPQLAFWVVLGIATTFAGALWLLPYFHVSINMLSMFAFIMVLGIVVDDAIIIGESVYRHQQRGLSSKDAALRGTVSVQRPVMLAVLSTVAFFLPLIDVPSDLLIYTRSIFFVVMLCLFFSLLESYFILPSHLSHMKPEVKARPSSGVLGRLAALRAFFSAALIKTARRVYLPILLWSMRNVASVFVCFFFVFALAVTVVAMGYIKMSPFPEVPRPMISINIGFAEGTRFAKVRAITQYVRDQVDVLKADARLLEQNDGKSFIREINKNINGHHASIFVGLTGDEERRLASSVIVERFRDLVGELPQAQSFTINAAMNGGGPEITLNLSLFDNDYAVQAAAVAEISSALQGFAGVHNVRNNLDAGKVELNIKLKPRAAPLGLSLDDVARQVRQGYYGEEIQRIARAKEDVRVMLRYPVAERESLESLSDIRIRTGTGAQIPLSTVAQLEFIPGAASIRRVDRKRNIVITAEVEDGFDAGQIVDALQLQYSEQWARNYAGFALSRDGNLRTQAKFGDNFKSNFIKIFFIVWVLFAIVFRSLFQPWLIMLAVPFGFVGAVIGHALWGSNISFFSMFGFLACAGVVVNDNLVLIERINLLRQRGLGLAKAVVRAAVDRFRPIVLTSLTTFIGLLPILFERSLQSQFLKPMVISLSFGVVFASFVTLVLVPCAYYSGYRAIDWLRRCNFYKLDSTSAKAFKVEQ